MNKNNRIIKFRAFDTKNNKFLEFVPPKEYMIDSEWDIRNCDDDENCLFFPAYPGTNRTFDDRIIYSQFTGLLDKSGREIYENDIIEFKILNTSNSFPQILRGYIEFNEIMARFHIVVNNSYKDGVYNFMDGYDHKIIGNVFQKQDDQIEECPNCDCKEIVYDKDDDEGYNS